MLLCNLAFSPTMVPSDQEEGQCVWCLTEFLTQVRTTTQLTHCGLCAATHPLSASEVPSHGDAQTCTSLTKGWKENSETALISKMLKDSLSLENLELKDLERLHEFWAEKETKHKTRYHRCTWNTQLSQSFLLQLPKEHSDPSLWRWYICFWVIY